jgi:tRNA threonylcarbamoyladenosine biosynthesis protein TsaB
LASDPYILGFDTSAAYCAAALLCGEELIAQRGEEMGRGQAERLIPLLEEVLAEGGIGWRDLARLGVGVGPGNFTGIRIAVSAARGLALALDIPAVGVSGFEAIAQTGATGLPAIAAPRERIYIAPNGEAPRLAARSDVTDPIALPPAPARMAEAIARCAAKATPPFTSPAPLYLRPADAAPARDLPPVILDDDG